MKKIKIATWNIGSLSEQKENESVLLSQVTELNADILCLQEFPDNDELAAKINLAGNYMYHKIVISSPSHVDKKHNMGIAIFSKIEPYDIIVHKLIKPYESLTTFFGQCESLHDKRYMAAVFDQFILITGHGFPCVRYCSPYIQYKKAQLDHWSDFCVSGVEYKNTFEDLDNWIISIKETYPASTIIIAADFNIDRQLDFLPKSRNYFYDVFEGQITRPEQYYMHGGYKTDAILCPMGTTFQDSCNITTVFDHHLLSLSIELSS